MEQHNPYQRPQASIDVVALEGEPELAGRMSRLAAAILDAIIGVVIVLPIMYVGGYFRTMAQGGPGLMTQIGWSAVGFAMFIAIHYIPLKNSGQTWGKKAAGIRIVDMDGQTPSLGVLLGKRYLFSGGIGLIPVLGAILSLVNVLFIFRGDRRCLHDLVADTQVVQAR